MRQLGIQARLSKLGASALARVLQAEPPARREVLVDLGASPELVAAFNGLLLSEQEAILIQSTRLARDSQQDAEFEGRRRWSALTGTEDLGAAAYGDVRQEPGTGAIDFSRLRLR
jgi:hypothetical protein